VKKLFLPIATGSAGIPSLGNRVVANGAGPPANPATATTSAAATISTVGDAMRQVLQAEREAAQQLSQCQLDCQSALEATRVDARRITERAEAIAQSIHGRIDRVASERAECRRQGSERAPTQPDEFRIEAAVAQLAARLTGAAQ